jgi:exodeoxyribonuclease VII small subunit
MTVKPKDFESALKKLEEIVKELEEADLSLEQSLERYEKGVSLARFCNTKLEEAEKRIAMLEKTPDGEAQRDADGNVVQTPLDFENDVP